MYYESDYLVLDIFLFGYMSLMVGIGVYAQRQIKHADDFATARGAYGPVFLALAFAASTASGATFLGSPAMSYEWGLSTLWMHFLYPVGVYVGIFNIHALGGHIGQPLR